MIFPTGKRIHYLEFILCRYLISTWPIGINCTPYSSNLKSTTHIIDMALGRTSEAVS